MAAEKSGMYFPVPLLCKVALAPDFKADLTNSSDHPEPSASENDLTNYVPGLAHVTGPGGTGEALADICRKIRHRKLEPIRRIHSKLLNQCIEIVTSFS